MKGFVRLGAGLALLALSACSGDDEGGGGGGGGGGQGVLATATVDRYGYAFDLVSAQAHATLDLTLQQQGDCLELASGIGLDNIYLGGEPARDAWVADGVVHACGPYHQAGESVSLEVDAVVPEQTFLGLDVGFSRQQDMAGGNYGYLLSWLGGCDHFGPCDDDPARLSAFHFEVTHPAGTVVLCPGTLQPGDTQTQCDITGTLAPTYSAFAIVADDKWMRAPWLSSAGVDLVFYEVPGGQLAASLDKTAVSSFLGWITGLLGPYPYGPELRVAGGPTRWLGFEHPGNIVLREDLSALGSSYADGTMHVLTHEMVHQWAGNRTTLAATADFVLKEATAEYLSYVFEDEHGPAGHADATRDFWHQASAHASYHPRPTDEPTPPLEDFYGDTYGPGPMVLYLQLEPLIGRAAVLDAIAALLAEPGVRGVDDLRLALEQASGADLSSYFDAWVFGSGAPSWPAFTATTDQQGDQVTVTVTQQATPLHGCVLEVDVHGATQTVTAAVDFGLAPAAPTAQAVVTLAELVVSTEIDPHHRVIEQSTAVAAAHSSPPPGWVR